MHPKENKKHYGLFLDLRRVLVSLLLFYLLSISIFPAQENGIHETTATALVPGTVSQINAYTDFFYYNPPEDYIYYLNDRFLFLERPDEIIVPSGRRQKLIEILDLHKEMKHVLKRAKRNEEGLYTLGIYGKTPLRITREFLNLLGLVIDRKQGYEYVITVNKDPKAISFYLDFGLYRSQLVHWNNQILMKGGFSFDLKESEVPVPFNYKFLEACTGLSLDKHTFFEQMIKNEKLSLFIGTLSRFSPQAIEYIRKLGTNKNRQQKNPVAGNWKEIYQDKKLLVGLFVLSHALRLEKGKNGVSWKLPGGIAAKQFWCDMVTKDVTNQPLEFLYNLAVNNDGKLNYLFLFGSFLSRDKQTAFFTGEGGVMMKTFFPHIQLGRREILEKRGFPLFGDANFFTLLYSLKLKDNKFHLPMGADAWVSAINRDLYSDYTSYLSKTHDYDEKKSKKGLQWLFRTLLLSSEFYGKRLRSSENIIRDFIAIYTKFAHRPELLDWSILRQMFAMNDRYNVLLDFIEKIPIKKKQTVQKLLAWVRKFEGLNGKDYSLYSAIFQSLFELISHMAKYGPQKHDYDLLVESVIAIPMERKLVYDQIFNFFNSRLGLEPNSHKELLDVILSGIDNHTVTIDTHEYNFLIRDIFKKKINSVLDSQDVCDFPVFLELNHALSQIIKLSKEPKETRNAAYYNQLGTQVVQLCYLLPFAEISGKAPRSIKERVTPYIKKDLNDQLRKLSTQLIDKHNFSRVMETITHMKQNFLLPQLKDHLVALVYGLTAKQSKLRVFLNPNLVRLHDFSGGKGRTAWNYCGNPPYSDGFSEYIFAGGLSRLNISFTKKWQIHLFNRTFVFSHEHVRAVLVNLLEHYPYVRSINPDNRQTEHTASFVKLGRDVMQSARKNPAERQKVIDMLGTMTTGYHYRRAIQYLTGKRKNHLLFASELKRLGELASPPRPGVQANGPGVRADNSRTRTSRLVSRKPGNIYYQNFGNLLPVSVDLFPQELSNFFQHGWLGGAMVNEFHVQMDCYLHKNNLPPLLGGDLLYHYFNKTAPVLFSQNHAKDYESTYFLYDIINDNRLNVILKDLQKEGHLQLK